MNWFVAVCKNSEVRNEYFKTEIEKKTGYTTIFLIIHIIHCMCCMFVVYIHIICVFEKVKRVLYTRTLYDVGFFLFIFIFMTVVFVFINKLKKIRAIIEASKSLFLLN